MQAQTLRCTLTLPKFHSRHPLCYLCCLTHLVVNNSRAFLTRILVRSRYVKPDEMNLADRGAPDGVKRKFKNFILSRFSVLDLRQRKSVAFRKPQQKILELPRRDVAIEPMVGFVDSVKHMLLEAATSIHLSTVAQKCIWICWQSNQHTIFPI